MNLIDPTGEATSTVVKSARVVNRARKIQRRYKGKVSWKQALNIATNEAIREIEIDADAISKDTKASITDQANAISDLLLGTTFNNVDSSGEEAPPDGLKDKKKISGGRIKQLGKGGLDAEELKGDFGFGGKEDLYTDNKGNIYIGAKDGSGEATDTGENIDDYLDE